MNKTDFKQDILKELETLINSEKLEVFVESDFRVLLIGKIYSVGVVFDTRDQHLHIFFKDNSNNIYNFWRLLKFMGIWHEWESFSLEYKDKGSELYLIGLFISHNVKKLLKNDFSWRVSFFEYEKQINDRYKKLFELGENHPIYRKYKENDPSWETDITKLLKD